MAAALPPHAASTWAIETIKIVSRAAPALDERRSTAFYYYAAHHKALPCAIVRRVAITAPYTFKPQPSRCGKPRRSRAPTSTSSAPSKITSLSSLCMSTNRRRGCWSIRVWTQTVSGTDRYNMACFQSVASWRSTRKCRQAGKPRTCGHRLCDQHSARHAATCKSEPRRPRPFTQRDQMRMMAAALGCPDPYRDRS